MNETHTVDAVKQLQARVDALTDTLDCIARRIDDLLNRPIQWSGAYLRTVLAEVAQTARQAVEEDSEYE